MNYPLTIIRYQQKWIIETTTLDILAIVDNILDAEAAAIQAIAADTGQKPNTFSVHISRIIRHL